MLPLTVKYPVADKTCQMLPLTVKYPVADKTCQMLPLTVNYPEADKTCQMPSRTATVAGQIQPQRSTVLGRTPSPSAFINQDLDIFSCYLMQFVMQCSSHTQKYQSSTSTTTTKNNNYNNKDTIQPYHTHQRTVGHLGLLPLRVDMDNPNQTVQQTNKKKKKKKKQPKKNPQKTNNKQTTNNVKLSSSNTYVTEPGHL